MRSGWTGPVAEPAWTPPLRDGISASRVGLHRPCEHILDFLLARFPAVIDWPQRLADGAVLDAQGRPVQADAPGHAGMLLWYWRAVPPEPRLPFEITVLYQDERLVVVDKPHFMAVTPGGRHLHQTVLVRLRQQLGITTLAPMHRLDRDTAGVLAFTVQPATRHAYQVLLQQRQVHKVYEAIAPWRDDLRLPQVCRHRLQERPGAAFMQMAVVDGAPNAETHIAVIGLVASQHGSDRPQPLALYRLTPGTGRKHQLRAQLSALGLPIVGDRLYPQLQPDPPPGAAPDFSQPLQLLARELAFTDPITGARHCFISQRQLALADAG